LDGFGSETAPGVWSKIQKVFTPHLHCRTAGFHTVLRINCRDLWLDVVSEVVTVFGVRKITSKRHRKRDDLFLKVWWGALAHDTEVVAVSSPSLVVEDAVNFGLARDVGGVDDHASAAKLALGIRENQVHIEMEGISTNHDLCVARCRSAIWINRADFDIELAIAILREKLISLPSLFGVKCCRLRPRLNNHYL